uniref:F-box domain-containing protein n=1 Tax=Guillardia theta TaxID=55529 RepID=A0A7S4NP19_GUITH|mmetsp:Transcript_26674/g.87491  ORF Transcript_26674/g.87491 Transcript_26674/m.87491 type:complete len:202 (+) Transcript_26674:52-657(+)
MNRNLVPSRAAARVAVSIRQKLRHGRGREQEHGEDRTATSMPNLELSHLPQEAMALIICRLCIHDVGLIARCSRQLRLLCSRSVIWRPVYEARWGPVDKSATSTWKALYKQRCAAVVRSQIMQLRMEESMWQEHERELREMVSREEDLVRRHNKRRRNAEASSEVLDRAREGRRKATEKLAVLQQRIREEERRYRLLKNKS